MIIAPIQDRYLRGLVRRAALPEEDVFYCFDDVRLALRFGYPRVLISRAEDQGGGVSNLLAVARGDLPVLALAGPTVRSWEAAWQAQGLAVSRVDDSALRLRALIKSTANSSNWIEALFSDLTHTLGQGLPSEFRGFARRILEFPFRYSSLRAVGNSVDVSPGALKARFRRRHLPSPSRYLRWFRLLAAARVLEDPDETILTASFRLGFASDGNFCRWVRATSGHNPSDLRDWNVRLSLLIRMAEECLSNGVLERWKTLGGLFLREVA
jgi:AraC-like DNA-binding protein